MSLSYTPSTHTDISATTSFTALNNDLHVDVAIVGGGVTGVTAALLLKRAGKRVALLEAHTIGAEYTPHTIAHLTTILSTRYQDLVASVGSDTARLLTKSSLDAIERIAAFVQDEQIACGFTRVPGYLYTESARERALIEEEVVVAQSLGLPARLTDDVPLPFAVVAAMELPDQAQFDALAYLHALVALIPGDGSDVFEHTPVLDVHDGEPCQVQTKHGTVFARDVLITAQTSRNHLAALQPKIAPYRSYVLGVKLHEPLPNALFWDTMDPYHYTRASHHVRGDVLIVGGEDHKIGHTSDTESHERQLEEYVRARFDVASVVYRSSTQFYTPTSGVPFIGLYLDHCHVYAAAGYGGNEMTLGTLAAMTLSDTLLGRENAWEALYLARQSTLSTSNKRLTSRASPVLYALATA